MKSDLLADLRAEVEAAAQAEQDLRAASKAARLADEARAAADAQAADAAAVAVRLEAEARRQALLVQARAALAEPVRAPQIEQAQPVATRAPIDPGLIAEPAPMQVDPPRGAGFWLAVMGVPLVCATAIAIAVIWSGDAPTPSPMMTAPTPVFEIVDAPGVPDAPVMPTAHIIATPTPIAAPASVEAPKRVTNSRIITRPAPKVRPTAPKSTFTLDPNFMNAD